MKLLLSCIFLASFFGHSLMAQVGRNTESKPKSDISSKAKKVSRKFVKEAGHTSCPLIESVTECKTEKVQPIKRNATDRSDTKRIKSDNPYRAWKEVIEEKGQ